MPSFTLFFAPFSPPLLCKSNPFAMHLINENEEKSKFV